MLRRGSPPSRVGSLRAAPPAAVAEVEQLAGRSLPSLLRRLYLEVGNAAAPVPQHHQGDR